MLSAEMCVHWVSLTEFDRCYPRLIYRLLQVIGSAYTCPPVFYRFKNANISSTERHELPNWIAILMGDGRTGEEMGYSNLNKALDCKYITKVSEEVSALTEITRSFQKSEFSVANYVT